MHGLPGPLLSLRRYIFSCDSEGSAAGPSAAPLQCMRPGRGGDGVPRPGLGSAPGRPALARVPRCDHGCGEVGWRKRGRLCPVKSARVFRLCAVTAAASGVREPRCAGAPHPG